MSAEVVVPFPAQLARPPRRFTQFEPRAVISAFREDDSAELVAALLLTMEDAPLTPVLCYPVRDIAQRAHVVVTVGEIVFRLQPDDCRTAADALVGEQAFPGCVGAAHDLREAANVADARLKHGGPLIRSAQPPGRTGMASTLAMAFAALILAAVNSVGVAF